MNHWALFRESFGKMLHPVLWVFGLLTALGGGFSVNLRMGQARPLADLPLGARALLGDYFRSNLPSILIAGLAISLVLLIFSAFGQTALISLINKLENRERISIGGGVDAGGKRFLHLLAVRIVLALPVLVIGALAAGSFLSAFSGLFDQTQGEQFFSFNTLGTALGLGFLTLIVSLLIGGISIGAERAVVIEELSIFDSIGLGVRLFLAQIGDILIIGLLFLVVFIVIGLMFGCVLIPLLFTNATFGSTQSGAIVLEAKIAGSIAGLALVAGLIVGALGSIFVTSVWTLAYRQWRADQVVKR
jgi:hypothetical protein